MVGEESSLVGRRYAPEGCIAMWKSSEARDDLMMPACPFEAACGRGVSLEACEQFEGAALILESLAVLEGEVEKRTLDRHERAMEASRERRRGNGARLLVGGEGARLTAEDVSGRLVQKDHECERAVRGFSPTIQLPCGGGLVGVAEMASNLRVERSILLEPDLTRPTIAWVTRRHPEPESENLINCNQSRNVKVPMVKKINEDVPTTCTFTLGVDSLERKCTFRAIIVQNKRDQDISH